MNQGTHLLTSRLLSLLLVGLILTSCSKNGEKDQLDSSGELVIDDSLQTANLPKPIPEPYAEIIVYDSIAFACYLIDPQAHSLAVLNLSETGEVYKFADWKDSTEVAFVANAGMYESDRTAKGLLISNFVETNPIDTATSGYGNFYLQPNGIFAIDSLGNPHILPTHSYLEEPSQRNIQYATQSGPMMLVDSLINAQFNKDSPNFNIRNGVGLREDGWLIFAQSLEEVTFYHFAEMMKSQTCSEALYLDGVISRSWFRDLPPHSLGAETSVGPLIVAFSSIPDSLAHE